MARSGPGRRRNEETSLELEKVASTPLGNGTSRVRLQTNSGEISCILHPAARGDAAVVWVGGAGGGLDGPAGGLYPRLAARLSEKGITSFRLDYRRPNELEDCVLDTLVGANYLETIGHSRIALVGHSFGGAVVILAGAESKAVVAVAALSSQTYGTSRVEELAGKPLLLMHGTADQVLDEVCSRDIYARAQEPKQLLLYPGCGHGLDECREEVDRDLLTWLEQVLH